MGLICDWVTDAAVGVDGNLFAESNGFDEVLFDFAGELIDTNTGLFLTHPRNISSNCVVYHCVRKVQQLAQSIAYFSVLQLPTQS